MDKNDEYGLDWWANSEHGGSRNRDGEGHLWTDLLCYPSNPILGVVSGNPQVMWRWQSLRDFNNAAPDICFGFEGAPGHQVNDQRGFGNLAFGGSYGGVGAFTAQVRGLWDALLGEGRRWFSFANSDYHNHYTSGGDDFYPGERESEHGRRA